MTNNLFSQKLEVANVGLRAFQEDLEAQDSSSVQVQWTPPRDYPQEVRDALNKLQDPALAERIRTANAGVVQRIIDAHPVLTGYGIALDTIPGMTKNTILHAGPPITWDRMNGPMRGAITGAIVFEGLAPNIAEAEKVAASGAIKFAPCHEHDTVGSMAGVTSASMYVHIVKNKVHGNVAYTNLSEQLAKILRMGANDQSVIDRLIWMRDVMGPMLAQAMEQAGEIDLRSMLAQALQMGDEDHNRNIAGTVLLFQALAPFMLETDFSTKDKRDVFEFIQSSDYFSGPTWMAVAKCALDAGHGVKDSTVVTTMCRNGTDFGIRVANFPGFEWFTGPAQKVIGPMMAGYTEKDSGLDIGDSAITETFGIGGFALAAAPAIAPLVGGSIDELLNYSKEMIDITTTTNPNLTIPVLNFRGIATGIDVMKVIETGVLPIIDTAIAHKEAGIGMIGTGLVHPPFEVFEKAIVALADSIV